MPSRILLVLAKIIIIIATNCKMLIFLLITLAVNTVILKNALFGWFGNKIF
jgi:hypothetical protein